MQLPNLPTERNDIPVPILKKLMTLIRLFSSSFPHADELEPTRSVERRERELPQLANSIMERFNPNRPITRTEKLEANIKWSSIDKLFPNRKPIESSTSFVTLPRTDGIDPSREYERIEQVDPKHPKLIMETLSCIVTIERNDINEPQCA
jgi:hypothetical protein